MPVLLRNISLSAMRNLLFVLLCLLPFVPTHADEIRVQGTVLEKGTRNPLAGVVISLRELPAVTAITSAEGSFALTLPEAGEYSVQVAASARHGALDHKLVLVASETPPPLTLYLPPLATLAEVTVTAARSPDQVSKNVVRGKTLRKLAGTSGDPLRALQSMPGVVTVNGSSAPAVRGSGPGDNFYYIDNLLVPKLFHYGSISVFNADLIEDFSLYSAAFSPHFGNATGAVIDVALRNPRSDRIGGKVDVNLIGANFLVEGPVNDSQSFYFAARRSYYDLFIKQVSPRPGMVVQMPVYADYQGKYLWRLNDDHKLTLHLLGASDRLKFNISADATTAQKEPILIGASTLSDASATQAVTLDSLLSDAWYNTLVLEHTTFHTRGVIGSAGNLDTNQDSYLLREKLGWEVATGHELTLGAELVNTAIRVDMDFVNATCTQFNPNCTLTTAPRVQLTDRYRTNTGSVSVQDRKRVLSQLTLVAGLRYSREDYTQRSATEPRLGAEWQWDADTLFTAGWGRHNQNPTGMQWARAFGNPALEHIRSEHRVVGVAHKVDADWNWKVEAYDKRFDRLVVDVPVLNYVNAASGKAYGVEWLLKKEETDRLSGWFVLNLAKSQRRNDLTGEAFRFAYDEPVNATLVGNYKESEEWSYGWKWNYHSGAPYTPIIGTNGTYPDGRSIPLYAAVNSGTLPPSHSLDLRVDRKYVFDTWKLSAYFELNNVYQRKNVVGYRYDPTYTTREPVYAFVLPISFGVQGEF